MSDRKKKSSSRKDKDKKSSKSRSSTDHGKSSSSHSDEKPKKSDGSDPASSVDFEAGQLFERMAASGATKITHSEFQALFRKMKGLMHNDSKAQPDSFEAGRLFERFDKDKNGSIAKNDFSRLFEEMQRGRARPTTLQPRSFQATSPQPSPYHPSQQPLLPHQFAPPSQAALPNYFTQQTDFNPQLGTNLSALQKRLLYQLDSKMALLVQQRQTVQQRMASVQAESQACEQEAGAFVTPIIERIRITEATKLAVLQKDVDDLEKEVEIVKGCKQQVRDSRVYEELLRLMAPAKQVAERPFKRHFDDPTQIRREVAELQLRLRHNDASTARTMGIKDHMIYNLLQERSANQEKLRVLSQRYKSEIGKWKQMTNQMLAEMAVQEAGANQQEDDLQRRTTLLDTAARYAADDNQGALRQLLAKWGQRNQQQQWRRNANGRGSGSSSGSNGSGTAAADAEAAVSLSRQTAGPSSFARNHTASSLPPRRSPSRLDGSHDPRFHERIGPITSDIAADPQAHGNNSRPPLHHRS